jgi:hypothetical protein
LSLALWEWRDGDAPDLKSDTRGAREELRSAFTAAVATLITWASLPVSEPRTVGKD